MTSLAHRVPLPDIRANKPDVHGSLTRVGVTDIKKTVEIMGSDRHAGPVVPTFSVFMGPLSCRSGDMSGNMETIEQALDEALDRPVYRIEGLCTDVSRHLLATHAEAARAEVRMHGEYMMKRRSPRTSLECQEFYDIYAGAIVTRDGLVRRTIGAKVIAMTACPCAQELSRDMAFNKLKRLGVDDETIVRFLSEMPMPTHNQRGTGTIMIESDDSTHISVESIIDIIEDSMSSRMYQLLKREDEKFMVESAHTNPKFVEDCVRTMARNLVHRFPDLPEDALITIEQVNEESIHRHNVYAERTATFGDLKKEVLSSGQST